MQCSWKTRAIPNIPVFDEFSFWWFLGIWNAAAESTFPRNCQHRFHKARAAAAAMSADKSHGSLSKRWEEAVDNTFFKIGHAVNGRSGFQFRRSTSIVAFTTRGSVNGRYSRTAIVEWINAPWIKLGQHRVFLVTPVLKDVHPCFSAVLRCPEKMYI